MKQLRRSLVLVAVLAFLTAGSLRAYITSAILEYCADDVVSFYLNGSTLLSRSDFQPFNYDILTTADGTLPLELFRENSDNLLAVENFDTEAGQMAVSYRLTVYHSDGDPVVVWSDPEMNKFLHLSLEEKSPLGWNQPGFDDSKWGQAFGVNKPGPYTEMTRLEDPAFSSLLGVGLVPYLVHRSDAMCRGGDHNLFRSHFKFPNNPAKCNIEVTPRNVVYGQSITVRLVPGPDTTEISQFNMMAWLPPTLQLTGASKGAHYDNALRRIHWVQSNRDMRVSYAKLNAKAVLGATGWGAPEKVLGPPKNRPRRGLNTPEAVLKDGAVPTHGIDGWFKMDAPLVDFSRGIPKIQGVVFHSQIRGGARDFDGKYDVDKMMFNYSITPKPKRFLEDDVNVMHTSWDNHWIDGYYHASEDMKARGGWTWDDIRNLAVVFNCKQVGKRDRNLMASVTAVVRYYYPDLVQPQMFAKVMEQRCTDLEMKTGVFRFGNPLVKGDPILIRANDHKCAPTPVPTATLTPVPIRAATPKPTSTPAPQEKIVIHLGCLSVNPDPVDYSGSFIGFCQKKPASITINIYKMGGGGVRRIEVGEQRASDLNTVFFNCLDDSGQLLPPGQYLLEVVAKAGNAIETRNNPFRVVKKRKK